jgi:hypothetical protein
MREYAWDIWALIPYLRIPRRIVLTIVFPILLWPRAGGLLLTAVARCWRWTSWIRRLKYLAASRI